MKRQVFGGCKVNCVKERETLTLTYHERTIQFRRDQEESP
jgi:hypothetical protein